MTFDPWRTGTRRLQHSSPAAALLHPRGRALPVMVSAFVCGHCFAINVVVVVRLESPVEDLIIDVYWFGSVL